MDSSERSDVVAQLIRLLDEHYVFPEVAAALAGPLSARLTQTTTAFGVDTHRTLEDRAEPGGTRAEPGGSDAADLRAFATELTGDLQSVNGDRHLRLIHHPDPLPEDFGEDDTDAAWMRRWADSTCGGVARVQRLPGNIGYLDICPVLFPPAFGGDAVGSAMSLLAGAEALLIDIRRCIGGEPSMVAVICGHLFDDDPVELSGIYHRASDRVGQIWTPPHLPGRRYGGTRPVYLLTSAATFSGAEHLAYDLQRLGRATVIGERTRGGAHPRRGFRVHPHLEATIPVARSVNPVTGGNWEGTGVTPDVAVPAADAPRVGYRLALDHVIAAGTADADVLAEARAAGYDPFGG
jgi:hypothetical protein